MLQVDMGSGFGGEDDVSRNDDIFGFLWAGAETELGGDEAFIHHAVTGEIVVLAVVDDWYVEHVSVLDCSSHETVVLHAFASVGNGDRSGIAERASWSKEFAGHADGDASSGEDVDHGFALNGVFNILDGSGCIGWRGSIGHADDAGVSACCCCAGTCCLLYTSDAADE